MSQGQSRFGAGNFISLGSEALVPTYYELLGIPLQASVQDVRRAYREKSKLYHPDTTTLPPQTATEKFQQLNEAYATLSSPERRLLYDRQIGYSALPVIQPLSSPGEDRCLRHRSAYLEPGERPLSPGELFALFILGLTFISCLLLAIVVGFSRGEIALQAVHLPQPLIPIQPSATAAPAQVAPPPPKPTPIPQSPPSTQTLPPSLPQPKPPAYEFPFDASRGYSTVQSSPSLH